MFFPKKLTASFLSLFMVVFKYRAIAKVKKGKQKKNLCLKVGWILRTCLWSWQFYHKLIIATTAALKENLQQKANTFPFSEQPQKRGRRLSLNIHSSIWIFLSYVLPCPVHLMCLIRSTPVPAVFSSRTSSGKMKFKALFSLLPCFC